jgi:hypothetical protein
MFSGGGLNLNPTAAGQGVTPGNGSINAFLVDSTDVTQINWGAGPGPVFPSSATEGCSIASQCNVFATTQNLKTPYVENWNLNIQQALSSTAMLQVAYVGNHGVDLYSVRDINQVNPNSPLESPANCDHCESAGRPLNANCSVANGGLGSGGPCFPYMGFLDQLGNLGNSIYHSLQVTFTKRYAHGLYFLAGYTYAHAIDTATSNTPSNTPQNSLDYAAERGNSDFDIRHRLTLSLSYDLPSKKSPLQMLQGWQVASIVTLEGSEPYSLYDFGDDVSLTGEFEDRWNISGPPGNIHWSPTAPLNYLPPTVFNTDANQNVISGTTTQAQQCVTAALAAGGQAAANQLNGNPNFANLAGFPSTSGGCYISGNTELTAPAPGNFGNSGRNIFRGPGFREWDFSIAKIWKFNERVKMQLRGEFFNILNHPNFDAFSLNNDLSVPSAVGTAIFTPDLGVASNPVLGTGGSRHIQLGAKVIW